MFQRFAADHALQLLQIIALESSDGKYSDSESDEVNNVIVDIQNKENSSDSDDGYTNQEAPINSDDGARARSSSDNDEQILLAKTDPTGGARFPPKLLLDDYSNTILLESVQDLLCIIFHIQHYTRHSSFSFRIFFNEPTLKNILKCTTSEAHRVPGNNSWTVTLDKLDKLMGLIVARGIIGGRTLPIKSI